jgi:hypothetical protein
VSVPAAAQDFIAPGRYRITVTQELPNVLRAGAPVTIEECVSAQRIASGAAFGVRGENPITSCEIADLAVDSAVLCYRIGCPEPNSPHAKARFVRTPSGYEGAIYLNMGGKNMTLTERHRAVWLGSCE